VLRLLFLLPLVLSLLWFVYLRLRGFSIRQGKQGFIYILAFSAIIAAFYTIMLWLTGT